MALAYLAPLPIMIATLGWGLDGGAIAAAISVAVLAVIAEPAVGAGLRGLGRRARLGARRRSRSRRSRDICSGSKADAPAHAPVGAIVSFAALLGMLGGVAVLTTVIVVYGGYREGGAPCRGGDQPPLAGDALRARARQPDRATSSPTRWCNTARRRSPASTLMMLLRQSLRGGALDPVVRNLSRPWPDMPTSLRAALAGRRRVPCSALARRSAPCPSRPRNISPSAPAAFGAALALQGLAVAHALSRGLKMRPLMLVALYACCILRAKYTLPVLAALGVIDRIPQAALARGRSSPPFPDRTKRR